MNIRHEKVYEQIKAIAPTVMLSDDINFVNWRVGIVISILAAPYFLYLLRKQA
jgi:hypothetical protein